MIIIARIVLILMGICIIFMAFRLVQVLMYAIPEIRKNIRERRKK